MTCISQATHFNTLQQRATRKLHKEASRRPHTATYCKYCNTCQHIAAQSSKLQQVSLSLTREHIVGATLQHTTTKNNTPQYTAAHCNALQQLKHIATYCNTLHNTLQHTISGGFRREHPVGTTLRHTTTHCNNLHHTATHCNTLRHTTTRCKTLQQVSCIREHLEGTTPACE